MHALTMLHRILSSRCPTMHDPMHDQWGQTRLICHDFLCFSDFLIATFANWAGAAVKPGGDEVAAAAMGSCIDI